MKALVLGGDGFLGSHMVDELVAEGHGVTVFDRFPEGRARHVGRHGDKVRLVRGEFGATEALRGALMGQDVAYHFISSTTPGSSWVDPMSEIDGNIRPSIQFLQLAGEAGIRRIAFASSGGTVYGVRNGPFNEDAPTMPVSPYGVGKLAIEGFIRHACAASPMEFDIYRIANAYGPRQPAGGGQGVIAIWMRRIREGGRVEALGLESIRDYVFVGDIARLMMFSARERRGSEVFNIGTGKGTSLTELIEIFRAVIPAHFEVAVGPGRPFDVSSIILSGEKIIREFPGFHYTPLEEGIRRTWEAAAAAPVR